MHFALAFGLLGSVLIAFAAYSAAHANCAGWLAVGVEIELAACLLALAAVYAARAAGVSVEDRLRRPAWSLLSGAVLLPYFALGLLSLYVARWFDREGLFNPVAPGLYLGRLPFPSERAWIRATAITAVLNLCWEFPQVSGMEREPGIATAHVLILDGSPPTAQQFRQAVTWAEQWRTEGRCARVHCAQGHGRTATIAAAILLKCGLTSDVDEALATIRAARPGARPSRREREALARFASRDAASG